MANVWIEIPASMKECREFTRLLKRHSEHHAKYDQFEVGDTVYVPSQRVKAKVLASNPHDLDSDLYDYYREGIYIRFESGAETVYHPNDLITMKDAIAKGKVQNGKVA